MGTKAGQNQLLRRSCNESKKKISPRPVAVAIIHDTVTCFL
jgi:hypothetical protein